VQCRFIGILLLSAGGLGSGLRKMAESLDQQLRNLVEAGWHVIESDFDTAAFLTWREAAVKCLNELMGPEFESPDYRGGVSNESPVDVGMDKADRRDGLLPVARAPQA